VKYSVITFGCRVNQADSLGFEESFRAMGDVAVEPEHADLVVVNSCSVTGSADQAVRQTVRRVVRQNPSVKVVVTGCYATRRPDEVGGLPNVIAIVPNERKDSLVRGVRLQPDLHLTTAERFAGGDGSCGAAIEPGMAGRTAYTLRVQTGCTERCSYCIIPSTRGTPRSVPLAEVLRQVARVCDAGFREIVLTGVHLGSYGRDRSPAESLTGLLRALNSVAEARALAERVRFRISSLEPMDCTEAIVDLVAASGAFAPHFHLPLQHASDRVLAAMRRPYTRADYARLVDRILDRMPGAAIGTDIIVGFPGETDDDFRMLAEYLESSRLSHVHVFPYSDRPGTEAAVMQSKVAPPVVRERGRVIREIGARLQMRFRAAAVGTEHRALTLEDGSLVVTGNYLKARIPPGHARNEWVRVRLTSEGEALVLT